MSQDREILRQYLEATRQLDEASCSRDLDKFVAASKSWADKAEAYADDLEENRYIVPAGLRDQIRWAQTIKRNDV